MPSERVRVGCAGWSIRKEHAGHFVAEGTHLGRYARTFPAVEINSSFYRPHRPATYARWASETPEDFRFSAKVPKAITHEKRLIGAEELLDRFLEETSALGAKRGPLLVQLPPSGRFDAKVVGAFFAGFRRRFSGAIACEPRHETWFTPEAESLLIDHEVARVAADPAVVPEAAEPGGWRGLVYYRWHGSPRMYYSAYPAESLDDLARALAKPSRSAEAWCIFDNTALGAATTDALAVMGRVGTRAQARPHPSPGASRGE